MAPELLPPGVAPVMPAGIEPFAAAPLSFAVPDEKGGGDERLEPAESEQPKAPATKPSPSTEHSPNPRRQRGMCTS